VITLNSSDDEVVVRVSGEVDHFTAPALERDLAAALDGAARVRVDVAALEFIDAAGLRVLAALADRTELTVVGARPPFVRLAELLGLDGHLATDALD
jgi:anti-anti-sigma factor